MKIVRIPSHFRAPSKRVSWSKLALIHKFSLIADIKKYADLHNILEIIRYEIFHSITQQRETSSQTKHQNVIPAKVRPVSNTYG